MQLKMLILSLLFIPGCLIFAQNDNATYAKYDFVQGDKIIFDDNLENEAPDNFPSKWNLTAGKVEVRKFQGSNVICMIEGNYATICPRMKERNYLPKRFTLEYDVWAKGEGADTYNFTVISFYDSDNYDGLEDWENQLQIGEEVLIKQIRAPYPNPADLISKWYHVALMVNERDIKVYVNQHRIAIIPMSSGKPTAISFGSLCSESDPKYIKNIRLAEGGEDPYKRLTTDGKIVAHILFDVAKSSIKGESMGAINQIAGLMKAHPEVKISVEGHTDSDGNDKENLTLSNDRANSVRTMLISLGIDQARLSSKGFGSTKPISDNNSNEGKANNRRVEFVLVK